LFRGIESTPCISLTITSASRPVRFDSQLMSHGCDQAHP
jgi:hypothetical protein